MIIAIGGPSNAGKSALAGIISQHLGRQHTAILCLDDFVFPESQLPRIRDHIDWEHPNTINRESLLTNLQNAAGNHDHVILEGFLVYSWPSICKLYDKNLFIDIPESEFYTRKKNDLRWGAEPQWYIEHIWKQYLSFGRPPEGLKVFSIDGLLPWPMEEILGFLNN